MQHKIKFPEFISKNISKEITKIIFDYQTGSQEINENILKLLLKIRSKQTFEYVLNLFQEDFSSFEVIQNTVVELKSHLHKKSLAQVKEIIKNKINSYEKRIIQLYQKIEPRLFNGIKILTISNSKTVLDLMKLMHQNGINPKVFVLKSLPGGEGKILYSKLKNLKINSYLIEDSALDEVIKMIDIVIIGADKILAEKWFVNKIGTKKLVNLARKNSKPVFFSRIKRETH